MTTNTENNQKLNNSLSLLKGMNPKTVNQGLLDMYTHYMEGENSDCQLDRSEKTQIFTNLIQVVNQLKNVTI